MESDCPRTRTRTAFPRISPMPLFAELNPCVASPRPILGEFFLPIPSSHSRTFLLCTELSTSTVDLRRQQERMIPATQWDLGYCLAGVPKTCRLIQSFGVDHD